MSFPEDEVRSTDAGSTHAVDILAFVEAQEIPSFYFETPYHLAPAPGGERLYALLRETLRSSRKIGIACVVIEARQHLAVLVPEGQSLVLNTLRWGIDDRQLADIEIDGDDDDDLYFPDTPAADAPGTYSLALSAASSRGSETRSGMTALAELDVRTRKSADIVIQEMDCLHDDEDLFTDDFLETTLRRQSHHPVRWANRAAAPTMRQPAGLSRRSRR